MDTDEKRWLMCVRACVRVCVCVCVFVCVLERARARACEECAFKFKYIINLLCIKNIKYLIVS